MYRSTIAVLALIVVTATAGAEDKVKKPIGTWVRENGDNKVTFVITADKLTATLKTGNGDLIVQTSYEVDKDGEVKSKITKIEKNELGAQIEEGHTFSFKHKIADGTMTISDLKGNNGEDPGDGPKSLVEGEYKKAKEKKEDKKDKDKKEEKK
jgi:hypothetical protein